MPKALEDYTRQLACVNFCRHEDVLVARCEEGMESEVEVEGNESKERVEMAGSEEGEVAEES